MRAYVFSDAALAKQAGRFVWLSIDSEKAQNAAFLARFPTEVSPTLLVIEPTAERAVLKWGSSATVPQLEKLLEDGERAARATDGAAQSADEVLARADRLRADTGSRAAAAAAAAYQEALAAGGPAWPRHARAVEALVMALDAAGDPVSCTRAARQHAPELARGPSFANVVATGLSCALSEPAGPPRIEDVRALEPLAREALALPDVLADDRSSLYQMLIDARTDAADAAAAKTLAADWLRFLEAQAARAPSAEARTAFDAHLVEAALKLGEPARALPALEASERDFPNDYNPPARKALVYRALHRPADALAACQRALARVEGPRRLRVLWQLADLQREQGDRQAARQSVDDAIRYAAALPAGQRDATGTKNALARLHRLRDQL
ncbi:MAG TPA: tetratricopeptide repeat protein [Polyangia bacterium]|nr:tetratricopeptide repeat protein [Polyangia bacterium]